MRKNIADTIKEGSLIGFRVNKNEDEILLKFLEMQTNRTQALKYLIEKEISENGVRDLSLILPGKRDLRKMILEKQGPEELGKLVNSVEKNEEYVFDNKDNTRHQENNEQDNLVKEYERNNKINSYDSYISEEDLVRALTNIISKDDLNKLMLETMMKMMVSESELITDKENSGMKTPNVKEGKEERDKEISILDSGEIDIDKWTNLGG